MHATILGSGVAGLACAIVLRRQGIQVDLFEKSATHIRSGMGFVLPPVAVKHLETLGLTPQDLGCELGAFSLWNDRGESLCHFALPNGTRAMRRSHLISLLAKQVPPEHIHFGADVKEWKLTSTQEIQELHFSDGSVRSTDWVIAADGIHSSARQRLYPKWPKKKARVQEFVSMVETTEFHSWMGNRLSKFQSHAKGLAFGMLPVSPTALVWYLQFDRSRYPAPDRWPDPHAKKAFVANLMRGWPERISSLIEATDFSEVHCWQPLDIDLVPSFYRNNLVLVGDAAHPLLPFTSHGVAAALADAFALGESFEETASLEACLPLYDQKRRLACQDLIEQGRAISNNFLQSEPTEIQIPIAK